MHNGSLRSVNYPKIWKRENVVPKVKPGKLKSAEISKFSPIRFSHARGREKVLINRIMHHILINKQQNQLVVLVPERREERERKYE